MPSRSAAIYAVLKQYWGFDRFRPLQEDIIRSVLEKKDTLALLPTGSGKSVCYQLPALLQPGICLVISPLIALMKDQITQLRKKGISALALHTGMSYKEVLKTLELAVNEKVKLLYLSPERVQTRLFKEFLPGLPVSLIAIDEAHCISQWGYDFRPGYLKLADLREALPEVPVLALTASATPMVQEDIIKQLPLRNVHVIKGSFLRESLSYSCFEEENKLSRILTIFQKVEGCGIVYCKSRKKTVEVCKYLQDKGISATYYHAGLDPQERNERQQHWAGGQVRVIVCTNAFGMGIDKPDVRAVVHYDVPDCLENYYQEAGRAGRDGEKAYAVLLYNQQELEELGHQLEKKYPDTAVIRKLYQAVADFLQIPSGYGEGNSYDFDLSLFTENFQIDRQVAVSALKALQAEGYCALNESVFVPSKVQFLGNRNSLENLEKTHPALEPLIKALLRNYEGIFSFPANISESYLSRILKLEPESIIQGLQTLHRHGIIDYTAKKDHPQFVLLSERVKAENLRFDKKAMQLRKELAGERLTQLKHFIASDDCRSANIGQYFGDKAIGQCGICDNCLKKKKKPVSVSEISHKILLLLASRELAFESLKNQLPAICEEEAIWKALQHLQAEERVTMRNDGIFQLT